MTDARPVSGRLVAGAASDGGRVRERNEDSVIAHSPVFAVADGMGGHADGELASRMVVEELEALATRAATQTLSREDVLSALRAANDRMVAASAEAGSRRPMGTTACGLAVIELDAETRWAVFNIGDSRVYRYADGDLQQVSLDHSEVAELVQAGVLDAAQAERYPRRNVITRSLGHDPMLDVDLWLAPITAGERYLMCTDGLTFELSDDELRAALAAGEPAQATADRLVRAALGAGGHDNVSAVVVDVATN